MMMRKIFTLIIAIAFFTNIKGQSGATTLDVVGWNLEFFGAPFNSGPTDKDLQEVNTKKIMRYLNADLYGVLEIVDTMRLRRLVDSLGNTEYGYVIAPYCTGNTTGTGASWTSGQKQAFIYRKSIFTNITTRGIMRNSAPAYTNWASGRFPFLFSATATVDGTSKNVNFILLHGKAGATQDDFNKRSGAAQELKDTLDAQFNAANVFIIGDFNDALQNSIYTGSPTSSYNAIVADSTDADHYKSITLPLGAAGQSSMINFPNVIDNHVISNEVNAFYVRGTARVQTDVTAVVPDYVTAHNTSDHYPVFSKYSLAGIITAVPNVTPAELGVKVTPNPFSETVFLTATKTLTDVKIRLVNMEGQTLQTLSYNVIAAGSTIIPQVPYLARGMYFMHIETKQFRTTVKLVHL